MEGNATISPNVSNYDTTIIYAEVPEWANIFGIFLMTLVTITGVVGNGLILVVQWKISDKTSTDFLVISMAGFELYCSGVNNSLMVLHHFKDLWSSIVSLPLCCFENFSIYLTSISTTFLLTAIALDRYIQTCQPLNTFYSKTKAKWICVALLVSSIVISGPSLGLITLDQKILECQRSTDYIVLANIFDLFLSAAFLAMFVIVVICYTKVTILLRRRHRQKEMLRSANTSLMLSNRTQSSHLPSSPTSDRPLTTLKIPKNKVCPTTDGQNNHSDPGDMGEHIKNSTIEVTNQDGSQLSSGSQSIFQEVVRKKRSERNVLNRTTLIMFLITTIFICTWLIHFIGSSMASPNTSNGLVVLQLLASLYRINCVTNAVFYISMSSRFRQSAKQLFFRN